jgi:L-ascorbate metabolism protein UlaG (beta-lactamase superfamily)
MRLRKLGHSCIRLEQAGKTLVIDPGSFSAPDALAGADGVLITHEHVDHIDVRALRTAAERSPNLPVWVNRSVAELLANGGLRVHSVAEGDRFRAVDGFDVQVIGEWHAVIHPDIPRVRNVTYLIDSTVFHPGDAFTLPGQSVDVLLLPVYAPWCKIAEVIDFARAVKPRLAVPIHDGLLNDGGRALVDRLLGPQGPGIGAEYRRLGENEAIEVP